MTINSYTEIGLSHLACQIRTPRIYKKQFSSPFMSTTKAHSANIIHSQESTFKAVSSSIQFHLSTMATWGELVERNQYGHLYNLLSFIA